MKCFYHSADLDGHCSGAIVKYKYPDCEMFGINYGDEFPWDKIEGGEDVFMVDFALQPLNPEMLKLAEMCNLTWIDHHKSAIEDFDALTEKPSMHCALSMDNSVAGCGMTWLTVMDEEVPLAVRLLSQYDVWNHDDQDTLPFQFGLRQYATDPNEQHLWRQLFAGAMVDDIIKEGSTILSYKASEDTKYCNACAFETELDGLKCIAVNKMLTNSQLFDPVWDPDKYDAMLTFGYRNGKWIVSLYSTKDDVDVSQVAKAHGGGGHKGAAGFQCYALPFALN